MGLTWGAFARRFGNKRTLFTRAMQGPICRVGDLLDEPSGRDDLKDLLERLRSRLWQRWPSRMQYCLATARAERDHEPDELVSGKEWCRCSGRSTTMARRRRTPPDARAPASDPLNEPKQALFMGSSPSPAVVCQDEHANREAAVQRRAADAADAADATGAAPGKPGQVGCHGNAPT